MTGFNQNDDSKNIDSSKSRSKFIDVNPVDVTGEIPRPANADPVSGQIPRAHLFGSGLSTHWLKML